MRLALKLATGAGKTTIMAMNTLETEGQMLQRVVPDLMGMKNIMVLNDEAHHCYREKPGGDDEGTLRETTYQGRARPLQPHRLHHAREL